MKEIISEVQQIFGGPGRNIGGYMSEFGIYNIALNPSQIESLYIAGNIPTFNLSFNDLNTDPSSVEI